MKISKIALPILALFFVVEQIGAGLPDPGMEIDASNTALVVTDPQNDFLSPDGVTWGVVGKNVEEIIQLIISKHCLKPRKKTALKYSSPHIITIRLIMDGNLKAH